MATWGVGHWDILRLELYLDWNSLADLPTLRIYPGNTGFFTIFRISGESIRIAGFSKMETFNFPLAIIVA